MQDTSSESKDPEKKIFHWVWFWILLGLVLLVVLFFSMLPVGIDYGIEAYLQDQGADQVKLEDVNFNPLTGRMTLTNLTVIIGAQTVLQIPQATFKIEWTPFIRKRFVLERFTINDLELIVAQLENGNWQIGGITLPTQEASTAPDSWGFSFQEATATNCSIKLISSRLKSDLAIEQAKIAKLTSWLYDDTARLELTGKLNDAPMQLQLDVSPFGGEILASGQIKLNGLNLKPFSPLLQPYLKKLAGRLDLDLNIETRQTADSGISHFQKGSVKLHQLHASMAGINLSKNNLAWNGAVRVNLAQSEKEMKISADGQLNGSKLTLDSENENLMLQQDSFSWQGKFDYAQDKSNQKITTDSQISLGELKLASPQFNLSEDRLTWQGPVEFSSAPETDGRKIVADGRLNGASLSVTIPNENIKLQQNNFSWQGKFDYAQDKSNQKITTDSQISLDELKLASPQFNLSEDRLTWQGPVEFSSAPETDGRKIVADGRLNGASLSVTIPNENVKLQQNNFGWQGKIDYAQDKNTQNMKTDGQISLVDLKMESPQFNLSEEQLTWQGPIEFSTTANSESQWIIAGGELNGSHLQMSLPGRKLKFEHQGLSWKGRLDTGKIDDFSALKAEGDVTVKDIQILQSDINQRLFNLNQFNLQTIKIDGLNVVNVSGILLNGLALFAESEAGPPSEADPSPLRIQEVKFENARLSQQKNLAIDAVRLTGVKGFLHRDREGKWPAIDRLASIQSDISSADQKQSGTSDIKANETSDKFNFRIGQVDISGDSGLHFKDGSVSPAFEMDLSILEAHFADLDSSQPQQPASIKLLVSDTENARLSLEGTLQPFAGQLNLDWVGKIRAFELPPLSPYAIRSTGYRFTSGELEADVPLKIDRNELKGEIDLTLLNPRIKRVKAEISGEKRRGKIQLNMTLDSALRLLRDEQNDVKLKIPISGNINDPQFSVADAVNKVLAKTLQKSALSYLKYMLGPYGIGISVAEFAYDQATKIRLNPIMFAPANDDLEEAAIDYLQRVAAIMKEYPTVQVSVCGVATESDRKAMNNNASTDAALLALAQNRMTRIEDHLVKLNGIEAKRIIACEPEIDKTADAKPRADLDL